MTATRSLRRREEFDAALRGGKRIAEPGLALSVVRRPAGPGRLGLSVKASDAVTRNRIKRRLRAAFRDSDVQGADVVARASEELAARDYQGIVAQFQRACEGAG